MPTDTPLRLRILDAVTDVPAADWDALAGPDAPPFARHAWLAAMEESGSATEETGWAPHHLTIWRGPKLVAAAPAYRKFHSMGEYIYDFGWADAAARLGVEYYPKLIVGGPLSPATVPRMLIAQGEDIPALRKALLIAAVESAQEAGCSSVHILYPTDEEADFLEEQGLARRVTLQFQWKNPGYASYDDYLSRFDSKRRHQLKRERAAAATQGITLRTVRSAELTQAHAKRAFEFYEATCERHSWGRVQLTPDFFSRVFKAMPDSVEMVEAVREGRVIAGAFNLATKERLYGRYWGSIEEHPFLHFHVCLYHSVDDCIRAGRKVFEPGAGGEHKVSRGFEPTAVHSAHVIFDRRLDSAVRDYVRRERARLNMAVEEAEQISGLKPWPLPKIQTG
ncbi:N-acetyltransferase [Myxococcus llanfairpwllgwyngyllgogerychwyrndrobwllllantysiliogogogochensis]|uniref:N-acetyltransferase n=1 Tax=Myxococcus llanfairpwllgwyngyllgogerychwyrndrobwllllantysiliogogogochensis TaxID=2590453 RepID=A0A540X7C4_9BACT|nr:GNAT family N-acetyltransferase [Myxococcus llanfairpwllgwyngyllgogerychwyrndrobwllllantysiliogogogochensis]TQF17196.1 N-acetyltransferase [Myxococcus llanfairpwllgwyngyllgogerychwyrndrobwllllantysiliogogogochensis]